MKFGLVHPDDIKRYLGELRYWHRRSWRWDDEEQMDRILNAHTVTIEKGSTDCFYGAGVRLAWWLSLLDVPDRLARVSQVNLDAGELSSQDRKLLARIVAQAAPG